MVAPPSMKAFLQGFWAIVPAAATLGPASAAEARVAPAVQIAVRRSMGFMVGSREGRAVRFDLENTAAQGDDQRTASGTSQSFFPALAHFE